MKKSTFFFFVFLAFSLSAQAYNIKGRVFDCETHKALSGIDIRIKDSNKGTFTNADGFFSIAGLAEGSYVLLVSSLWTEEKTVVVNLSKQTKDLKINLCEKSIDLEQLVVTATRTERTLKSVPLATQLISSKMIERSQTVDFQNFLANELPGVEFTDHGGSANISMLGFGAKYVLFLVDGERMAGETFDNIDYNRIDMENIEQIEIVKGASASLYGSNAIGGVINIISKKPKNGFQAAANSRVATNHFQNHGFSLGMRKKWGYATLRGSFKQQEPYQILSREAKVKEFQDGTVESQFNSDPTEIYGYSDFSVTPKISFDFTEKLKLEAQTGYYRKERKSKSLLSQKVGSFYNNYAFNLKSAHKFSEDENLSLSLNYDNYDKFDYYVELKESEKQYDNSQWRLGGIYSRQIAKKHSLVFGFEGFSEVLYSFMFEDENKKIQSIDAQTYSLYTQQEWMLHKTLTLLVGGRFDYHSQFKGFFTPRLSAMYRPNSALVFRGGYAGGFRSPTLKELYTNWFHPNGGGFQIVGSKNLTPEKSDNFNLSTEITIGKTVITAMGQYSKINNLVGMTPLENDTIHYINKGATKVLSSELTASHQINNSLFLQAAYAFVQDFLGNKSARRPHSATFRIDYSAKFFNKYNPSFSFSGKVHSGMSIWSDGAVMGGDPSAINKPYKVSYEAYSMWRLNFTQKLPYNLSLHGGIDNLFNYKAQFVDFFTPVSPGRTYFVGLKWRL